MLQLQYCDRQQNKSAAAAVAQTATVAGLVTGPGRVPVSHVGFRFDFSACGLVDLVRAQLHDIRAMADALSGRCRTPPHNGQIAWLSFLKMVLATRIWAAEGPSLDELLQAQPAWKRDALCREYPNVMHLTTPRCAHESTWARSGPRRCQTRLLDIPRLSSVDAFA